MSADRPTRAIHGPLPDGHEHPSRSVVTVVIPVHPLLGYVHRDEFHGLAEGIRDGAISIRAGVLVDQRGPRAVVTHASHEVTQTGARLGRQGVARVPKIVGAP